MSKILYLSVHEILEYDEVKLFSELGHEVYSMGAYTMPGGDEHRKRPALELPYDPHFIELALQYPKEHLHKEQLEGVDIVIIMHEPKLVENNWQVLKNEVIDRGGRVIWRSIGQSIPAVERRLKPYRGQGLEVVRYSPKEETIKDYVGSDALIRFYKDPEEYKDWLGSNMQVINFTQSIRQRAQHCGWEWWDYISKNYASTLYGPGNDHVSNWGGMLSYERQLVEMQMNRLYFYHGTYPASYTLSLIEAMMVGMPIIAVGAEHGNGPMFPEQSTYEAHEILEDAGIVIQNVPALAGAIEMLLADQKIAEQMSSAIRLKAINMFGKNKIKKEWEYYLSHERT